MKTILDIGKQGAEQLDVLAPEPTLGVDALLPFTQHIARFPVSSIEAETDNGTKRSIEVHTLLLSNPQVFDMLWQLAPFEPIVYAQQGQRKAMGILSPNYDSEGVDRQPTIKMLPLQQAYPLRQKGNDLLPNAEMATMLAGSAHAEGQGVGSHDTPVDKDYEHKLAINGAVSLGKLSISENGKHVQHAVRDGSSVATGLTNGQLGDVFKPNGDTSGGFTGYGAPLVFERGRAEPADAIYIPKGFLEQEQAYGISYPDAAQIAYGASRQILYDRYGKNVVSTRLSQIVSLG